MLRVIVENVPPLDQGKEPSGQFAASLTSVAIFAGVILTAALFGNFTRPAGHLSAFWPANALMLGMLVRNPKLARPFALLGAAGAYMCADLISGGPLVMTLLLTIANMVSVMAGYQLFSRLDPLDQRLGRPLSIFYLVLGAALCAAAAGVVGGIANPLLFQGSVLEGWGFWFVSELVNYIAILPVILTLPALAWSKDKADVSRYASLNVTPAMLAPAAFLVLSAIAGLVVGGPGAIGFPVPALLWCALVYSQFMTAVLTLLFSGWTLLAISMGYIPLGLDNNEWSTVMSIRMGVTLIALAPVTVASVTAVRNELMRRLQHMAAHDQLTDLLNRGGFKARSQALLGLPSAAKQPVAMLMLDIDRFKDINDTYGHAAGDRVLSAFARLAAAKLRGGDPFGRIGGEEFAILLSDCSRECAEQIAHHIRTVFEQATIDVGDGRSITATVSIGLVMAEKPIVDLDALLLAADKSLYRAKREGRNRVELGELDAGPSMLFDGWRA
ncbi:MAG TPA: diguanylate cyclase [Mesorhizobium sp.]